MKLHAFLLASVLAAGSLSLVFAQQPPQPRPAQPAPARAASQQAPRCIPQDPEAAIKKLNDLEVVEQAEHAELFATTKIFPAGAVVDLVLQRPYDNHLKYHVVVEEPLLGDVGLVIARKAPEDHPLIKSKRVTGEATLIAFELPSDLQSAWAHAEVHVVGCKGERIEFDSSITKPMSSRLYSNLLVWPLLGLLYVFAAFASAKADKQKLKWFRYLDPVVLTAGANGKGSLTNLQILFFSAIVVGLVGYIVARTGILSDLSMTILTLLGIAGGGAALSKAADANRNRLEFQNWAWFIRKRWLPPDGMSSVNEAAWKDILTTNGEFDVYHFQSMTLSLAVGGALLTTGFTDLAAFTIPDSLLGVLGLSQVIYIAGKMVAPPTCKELNDATTELRATEREFVNAANAADPAAPPGSPPVPPPDLKEAVRRAGADKYAAYIDKAKDVQIMFKAVFGRNVPDPLIQPAFSHY